MMSDVLRGCDHGERQGERGAGQRGAALRRTAAGEERGPGRGRTRASSSMGAVSTFPCARFAPLSPPSLPPVREGLKISLALPYLLDEGVGVLGVGGGGAEGEQRRRRATGQERTGQGGAVRPGGRPEQEGGRHGGGAACVCLACARPLSLSEKTECRGRGTDLSQRVNGPLSHSS